MARPPSRPQKKSSLACFCNRVPLERVEEAILRGCNTLSKIFDATSAGVGPCGGSCRPRLAQWLETYLKTGSFPQRDK